MELKIAFFIIVISVSNVFASPAYSQVAKVSLHMENKSLEEVMDEIESQSEFYFIFNQKQIDVNRVVSIQEENRLITDILPELFKGTNVNYAVIDRKILLTTDPLENNLLATTSVTGQQQNRITGTVTDKNGPIPGVNIVVTGTTQGSLTDMAGKYSIDVPPTGKSLTFSFIGMAPQEITIGTLTQINVTMAESAIGLEEVVVIGYGTQKRANVVGSVTSITGDQIRSIPASDITNSISGRLPGSVIIQQSGEPGHDAARILIRGRSTLTPAGATDLYQNTGPLIIVDGIPGRELSEIDPADISSISVLKDASAAIYGASSANGVILVTTKKGQEGRPTLNYQFYQGFMQPTVIPKTTNAGDYATMLTEYQTQNGKPRTYTDADIALFYSGADPWQHPNTNWYKDLIANWTSSDKHTLTLSGGTKGMNYYVSLGMKGNDGIYKQASTRFKQYNLRAKIELPITDWLKTSIDVAGFQTERRYPTKNAAAIVGQATRLAPTQWSFWPNGKPGPDIEYGDNPVVTSTLETGTDDQKYYKIQNTFNVTITPPFIKGLALNAYFNYDVSNQYHKIFVKPWILYSPDWPSAVRDPSTGFITDMNLKPAPRGVSSPQLTEDYGRQVNKLGNINFSYNNKFGNHGLSLFGSYEQYTEDYNTFNAYRTYFITDVVQTLNAGADAEKTNSGTMSIYARKSYIARVSYNYKEKYLAEVLFRRDGSLKFPPKSRWGNFPGFLLGWRASEENFWKDHISFINYFKLRASYGVIGMDPGALFQYLNKYNISTGLPMGSSKVLEVSVLQAGVANPFITWEKQITQNVGFDSKWFNDMFHLNTEFFYNKRTDILAPRDASVPGFTGIALPDENIARVDNRGFEIDAGFHKSINTNFRFDLTGNFSFNRNKVVFMDEPQRTVPWQVRTGHPYGAVLLYKAIGIFADQAAVDAYPHLSGAKPGDVIFEDTDASGIINSDDKILLDNADAPEIFYGVILDLTYKAFTLSILAQGAGKYLVPNTPDERRGEAGNYFQWNFDGRWTPENINASIGRAWDRNNFYWAPAVNNSTYWYSNMAYCRLKNVILNYDIPKRLYSRLGISKASVSVSGNNLFLIWAAQKYFDPEIANPMVYPAMKTFAIGANITF